MADVTFTVTGLSSTSNLGGLAYSGVPEGWGRYEWGRADWGDTNFVEQGWGTLNWGQNGWGSVESAVFNLTGLSATTTLGTVTPEDVVGLTGLSADIQLNSLALVKSDLTFTLTGLGLISSHGLLTEDDHSVGLAGQSATVTPGSLTPADIMGVTGISADIDLGTLGFTSNPLITVTGLSATTTLGSVESLPVTLVAPTGQSLTSAIGTVTTTQLSNVFPEGQVATTSLDDTGLILKYYHRLTPHTSGGYTRETAKTSTGYTRKNPKTSTGYTRKNPA